MKFYITPKVPYFLSGIRVLLDFMIILCGMVSLAVSTEKFVFHLTMEEKEQKSQIAAIENARTILWAQQKWPGVYLFKFIVPNDKVKLDQVRKLFQSEEEITYRTSKDIKFISLSCKQEMKNPDEVLEIYRKAGEITGVISL